MTIPAETDVLIVGGGPAGALLGALLARRGIDVVVVEKQHHLDRDFRGETLAAPSVVTLHKLGFGPALAEHGYLETTAVSMRMEGREVLTVDYGRFAGRTLPIDIPQPALIGIFNEAARRPNHHYLFGTGCTGLLEEDGAIKGAVFKQQGGERFTIRARLVVGADGRFSKVRKEAGLSAHIQPMERDFVSFKLPRPAGWGNAAELVVDRDRHLVVLPTFPDFLRVGHNLPKRGFGELRKRGIEAFRDGIAAIDPRLRRPVDEHLLSWDDTGFLEIFTAEVDQWTRDGLVLIGDASHTCTPILGQGVNLAIQDVVTITPVIAAALARGARGGTVPAHVFDGFVATRKAHKSKVTGFQRMQEAALAQHTPLGVALRRLRFSTLNKLPLKYVMFEKVISVPHPVDPVDEQNAKALVAS
ncbi:FAD-dependent monooxygenase [Streptomyces sp. FH025]|uniref:FAD-dependent monooxygenase n=1 Tax=Streptomyces sp. FH025 TaxID=2815937 RepID=UPI001A9E0055|nr:FAD-dependent monooxygenase [Streptomyces sp. FH025]MBO1413057.1 FAD-dependent monooxygenase [Streptomyces sp. FH025]